MDGGNVSVEVGTHCVEGVQQFNMFGTPDRYEEKSIHSVIRYILHAGRNVASERSSVS